MTDVAQQVRDMRAALEQEERQLNEALKQLQVRLSRVRAVLAPLAALDSEEPVEFEGGLADAIRTVLMSKEASFVPTHVRDLVKAMGYAFPEGSNQMAAVHGVLKRLEQSGAVKTKEWKKQPGVTRYYWSTFEPVLVSTPGTLPSKPPNPVKTVISGIIETSQANRERLTGKKGGTE